MPVGQDYRDLLKLIPAVQVTQDTVRGPSAGGSGQDNVYQFDGVNVTLPLFGTLASEPASHDIEQVTTVRGGARAVDFDRSGGFTIDSVSKSGTNRFSGMIQSQFQTPGMSAELSGARITLRAEQVVDFGEPRRADRSGQAVLLRLLLPSGPRSRED